MGTPSPSKEESEAHHQRDRLEDDPVTHDAVGILDVIFAATGHGDDAPEEDQGDDAEGGEKDNLIEWHERGCLVPELVSHR